MNPTILLIIIGSIVAYKAGLAKILLRAATLGPRYEPPKKYKRPRRYDKIRSYHAEISEREKLEKQAAIIVKAMGEDPRTVKYMGEGLLIALINDYTKYNK